MTCNVKISTNDEYHNISIQVVRLTFESIDIEEGPSCSFDSLTVYDGGPMDNELGVFCGMNVPDPITSTSNEMTLKFKSDESASHTGFKATYQLVNSKLMSPLKTGKLDMTLRLLF